MCWKWRRNLIPFLVFLLPLGGCAATSGSRANYVDPNMDFASVRSVAVMPFGNLTTHTTAADRVRDVFMTMLQATGGVYVIPPGEVARGVSRAGISTPATPSPEDVVKLAKIISADAVITGLVSEYGEVRSGAAVANVAVVSAQMMEGQTGKLVWSASTSKGGITIVDRLFGGGGEPMNPVTQRAVNDLLDKLFGK